MNKKTEIKLPSLLSFERKLETSDGLMYAGNWDDRKKDYIDDKKKNLAWNPIKITSRYNRATKSMYSIRNKDSEKIEPNLAEGDDANLPMNKDTLKLYFTLRVVGNLGKPFSCNKPDFAEVLKSKIEKFKNSQNIDDLAFRYAYNIANGRFLWRNRVCAERVKIYVNDNLQFNAYNFSLNNFDINSNDKDLGKLSDIIKEGLKSKNDYSLIKVTAYVRLGEGQHIFPSQEMNMGEKRKTLFQLENCAAMHNHKISNAIKTIDTWYGDTMLIKLEGKKTEVVSIDSEIKPPIAIEPYGSVTQHGRAYRHNNNHLYSLLLSWVNNHDVDSNQQKFIVSNLIRGGLFGGDSE